MSNLEIILLGQCIVFVGIVINAVMTFWTNMTASKIQAQTREIHLSINSRLDALLKAEKRSSFAEGVAKSAGDEQVRRQTPNS